MTTELEIKYIKQSIREILLEIDEKYQDDEIALEVLITLICNRLVEIRIANDCWGNH